MNLKNNLKKDIFILKTQFKANKQRSTMNAIVNTKYIVKISMTWVLFNKLFRVYTKINNEQKN